MSKPTISRGPASRYSAPGEAIVEIHSSALKKGCLLSVREVETPDGPKLLIEIYRADPGVLLRANGSDTSAAS